MNNTVLASLIVGAVVVSAAAAVMINSGAAPWQKYAKVVAVEPAFETNRVPRQVCAQEARLATSGTPAQPADTQKPKPAESTAKPATGEEDAGDCVVVYDMQSIQAGYDVTYELDGVEKVMRMDRDPGERIPVENGELVLSRG